MTFDEVYKKYLEYARNRHKKQGFIIIIQNFKNHILPYFTGYNIYNLTKIDIINWQDIILSKNFSNKYNAMLYSNFKIFIDYCILLDIFENNIVSQVGAFKKKIEYKEHKVFNLKQFIKFSYYLDNFIIRQYFTFMFFYGTRPSETMALRFSDINGSDVFIQHNLQRKGRRELDTPKNQSSIRHIKINLVMRFRIWLLKKYYGNNNCDYFVFGGSKPLAPTTIDRYKKKACKKANLYEITQHEFRHSYATRMISKGKPINKVSKTMGHSTISITLDVYTH
ncbi:MAG: tyrosine-type recombinase/integrase [bacterium]|nr:tyrosine-type recombinase/integrase [bacterium]